DRAFVPEELFVLGVPVPGDHERGTGIEVVFDQVGPVPGPAVEEISRGRVGRGIQGIAPVVIGAVLVRIDDDVPFAVEGGAAACVHVLHGGRGGRGSSRRQYDERAQ